MLAREDIEHALGELRLNTGSHVLVHTSYRSLGGVSGGPHTVVRALVNTFGTLAMPSFTSDRTFVWDARGNVRGNAYPAEPPGTREHAPEPYTYDTPANKTMGIINETFRVSYPISRTRHPSASFIAYGAIADELTGAGTEVDGVEPIQRLMAAGGHVLLFGVTHSNSTAIHLAEQIAGRELFVRYCLTPDGVVAARGGGCSAEFDQLHDHVRHLERTTTLGKATLRAYQLRPYVQAAVDLIRRDPEALLCANRCDRCDAHRQRSFVS